MNGTVRQSPAMDIQRRSCFNARWRLRLTGPTLSLRAPVGRASAAPPGISYKGWRDPSGSHRQWTSSASPLQCPVAAAPYRAYTRFRNDVGRASAAPPGISYKGWRDPSGSHRQWTSSASPASMPGGGCAFTGPTRGSVTM
ncbi:hypothetical protein FZ928_07965 [Klebsiella pneumoniae]|uniref:Uncharacterized protein n=1 Tax=Klebsiella pneumoniae TaxID=573 RepID=A0A5C2LLN5_KLEPN|nr:hypothetical protein FZ928_07965 [Klebsiella pneumoniae]